MAKQWTVLYVDDEPEFRDLVVFALGSRFRVIGVESCAEALGVIRDFTPDIVLLDVVMPGQDGPATLAELRKWPTMAQVPAVFLTASDTPSQIAALLALGAAGVVRKPIDFNTLGNEILACVEPSP